MKTSLWVLLFLCSTMLFGEVLFYDDFDRNEGEAVGNGWTNIGQVNPIIENGGMKVVSNSLQGVRRDFSALGITSGIYYVSWDWKIGSNNWLADAFPNGTISYLRHDYEGSLYYDNTSDFSNPIQIGSLAFDTWANFKLKVNLDTDRFSIWINNTLLADNIAGLAVSDFTRFTFRAGSGSAVTQYIDNFIIYNDITPAIPTNLTAVGDVNNISLSWNGNPQDFLTYRIYRGISSPATTFLAEVQSPQTSYVDNTAAANTDYFYRVKAVSLGDVTSKVMLKWADEKGVQLGFIAKGKPTQNGFIESFNGKMRKECLDRHIFRNLFEAKEVIMNWASHYNEERPHRSLNYVAPYEFINAYNVKANSPLQTGL